METSKTFFMRARMRSLARWGVISALAAFCVLAVTATDDPVEALPQVARAVSRMDQARTISGYPGLAYYRGNCRDLFEFKEPPQARVFRPVVLDETVTPTPKSKPEPEPEVEPDLDLSGVVLNGVIAGTGGDGWAIVSGAGKYDTVVRRGDKLRGATVERVESDRIVLRRNKLTGELRLRTTFKPFAGKTTRSKASEPEPEAKEPPAPRQRRSLGISVRRYAGPGLLITRVRRPDIDVRHGDILKAIDGQPVQTMSEAVHLIRKASQQKTVRLAISRAGQDKTINVPMEE